jgi:hypothetical protein
LLSFTLHLFYYFIEDEDFPYVHTSYSILNLLQVWYVVVKLKGQMLRVSEPVIEMGANRSSWCLIIATKDVLILKTAKKLIEDMSL